MNTTSLLQAALQQKGPRLGINLPHGYQSYPEGKNDPCFFISATDKMSAQKAGHYRHMKVVPGKFLDYTTRTYYPTFEEWVASIPNINNSDIFFGFQRWDGKNNCVSLAYVISLIHSEQQVVVPTVPLQVLPESPPNEEIDELSRLIDMMRLQNINIDDVRIKAFISARKWLEDME
jgi:hypothetical protein